MVMSSGDPAEDDKHPHYQAGLPRRMHEELGLPPGYLWGTFQAKCSFTPENSEFPLTIGSCSQFALNV